MNYNLLFEILTMSQNDRMRLVQCMKCKKDPDICGASEKDEDENGLCKLFKRRQDEYRSNQRKSRN